MKSDLMIDNELKVYLIYTAVIVLLVLGVIIIFGLPIYNFYTSTEGMMQTFKTRYGIHPIVLWLLLQS